MSEPTDQEEIIDAAVAGLDGIDRRDIVAMLVKAESERDSALRATMSPTEPSPIFEARARREGWIEVEGYPGPIECDGVSKIVADASIVVPSDVEFAPQRPRPTLVDAVLDLPTLRARLCDDGPIYASIQGPETTAMLTLDYDDGFQLVMENNDVGGGPAVEVSEVLALAWAAQFGDGAGS